MVGRVWPQHNVHIGVAFPQLVHGRFFHRHAATQRNQHPGPLLFQVFQRANVAKNALLGMFAYGAGVKNNQIGLLWRAHQGIAQILQGAFQALAVANILLAAKIAHKSGRNIAIMCRNNLFCVLVSLVLQTVHIATMSPSAGQNTPSTVPKFPSAQPHISTGLF